MDEQAQQHGTCTMNYVVATRNHPLEMREEVRRIALFITLLAVCASPVERNRPHAPAN
jgi:hypothetical protein